jgi:hypothetical protein
MARARRFASDAEKAHDQAQNSFEAARVVWSGAERRVTELRRQLITQIDAAAKLAAGDET